MTLAQMIVASSVFPVTEILAMEDHKLWNPLDEGEPDWKSNMSRSKSLVAASRTYTRPEK
jgi:hypothetical protein